MQYRGTEPCACVRRGIGRRRGYTLIRHHTLGTGAHLGEHRLVLGSERSPSQFERAHLWIVPARGRGCAATGDASAHAFEQLPFEKPFQSRGLRGHRHSGVVVGMANLGHVDQRLLPHRHDRAGLRIRPYRLPERIGAVHHRCHLVNKAPQRHLQLPRRARTSIGQSEWFVEGQVVRHRVHGGDRVEKRKGTQLIRQVVIQCRCLLGHPKQHACRAELQHVRHFQAVGIAHDHMESAHLVRRMRLVAGVHDRPVESGLQTHFHMEVIGTLTQLVACPFPALAEPHTSRARVDLPRGEMDQHERSHYIEVHIATQQIILMAPPRSALAIRIVAEYLELMPLSARGLGGLTHKQIAGEIIGHGLKRIARLRRGVCA